ncbi:hypothetical protein ACFL96_10270 [Thermoproteota archaeon]
MKKCIILATMLITSIFLMSITVFTAGCGSHKVVNSFEECVAAGMPVMESYPRQCRAPDGQVFTEVLSDDEQPKPPIVGGDEDEHGCIGTAGYIWCESKQKCLRDWEEDCPENDIENDTEGITTDITELEATAEEYCGQEAVEDVYVCEDYFVVISSMPGTGSTYYNVNGTEIDCPVVALDSMSEECKRLTVESECESDNLCSLE